MAQCLITEVQGNFTFTYYSLYSCPTFEGTEGLEPAFVKAPGSGAIWTDMQIPGRSTEY
jgi:hypothetical protein